MEDILGFNIPKEMIVKRRKSWNSLFERYSAEVSDDIVFNISTLETEEVASPKGYPTNFSCMRKPTSLIQHWVDTGTMSYNCETSAKDGSDTGSSLSEEENSILLCDNTVQLDRCSREQEGNNEQSSSSVDTAAYILSNTNTTNKAEAIAIMEGAKPSNTNLGKNKSSDVQCTLIDTVDGSQLENVKILKKLDTKVGPESVICNFSMCINKNIDAEKLDNAQCERRTGYTQIKSIENNTSNISPIKQKEDSKIVYENNDVPAFQNSSKSLLNENLLDNQSFLGDFHFVANVEQNSDIAKTVNNCTTERDSEQELAQIFTFTNNSVKAIRRKKLFTNRNSPINLASVSKNKKNVSYGARPSLHPALDSTNTACRKSFLTKKNRVQFKKRKLQSLFSQRSSTLNNSKKRINISDEDREKMMALNDESSNDIDLSCKNQYVYIPRKLKGLVNNIESMGKNTAQSEMSKSKEVPLINERDVNLEKYAVVRLERLPEEVTRRFMSKKSDTRETLSSKGSSQNMQDKLSRSLKREVNISSYNIENIDVDTTESDQSTILIWKCSTDKSKSNFSTVSDLSTSDVNLGIISNDTSKELQEDLKPSRLRTDAKYFREGIVKEAIVVLEKLEVDYSGKKVTTSKQGLMELDLSSKINDNSEITSSVKSTNHCIDKHLSVPLERISPKVITGRTLPNNTNGFSKKTWDNVIKTYKYDLFGDEDVFRERKEDKKYSFLHLPSSDGEEDFIKFIQTVNSKRKSITSRTKTSKGDGSVVKKERRTLPINAQRPLRVMSAIIASSSEDDENDMKKQVRDSSLRQSSKSWTDSLSSRRRKRLTASIQRESSTSSENSLESNKRQLDSATSDQRKTEVDILQKDMKPSCTVVSQRSVNSSTTKTKLLRKRKGSVRISKRKEQSELKKPKTIRNLIPLKPGFIDSDTDSDACYLIVRPTRSSITTMGSPVRLKESPKKRSSVISKKANTSTEYSPKKEEVESGFTQFKPESRISPYVVRKNLKFSSSSDSDGLFIMCSPKHRGSNRASGIYQDNTKSPTKKSSEDSLNARVDKIGKHVRKTYLLRRKGAVASYAAKKDVNVTSCTSASLEDDSQVICKRSKIMPANKKSTQLKVHDAKRESMNSIEKRNGELSNIVVRPSKLSNERTRSGKIVSLTTKPLIFQTKTCYESDSD